MTFDITTVIALYAAVLSTAGLGWNIFVWLRDRYDLRLMVHTEQVFEREETPRETDGPSSSRFEMVFRIVNLGRQPATLVDGGFDFETGETSRTYRAATDAKDANMFPVVLQPGDWHELRFPAAPSRSALASHFGDAEFKLRWWARDAKGKTYNTGWREPCRANE